MVLAFGVERAGRGPRPIGRIVKFGAGQGVVARVHVPGAPGDEDLAIGQQRRGVQVARDVKSSAGGPGPAGRVVDLGAVGRIVVGVVPARCDENLAIGQQRRRVRVTRSFQRAGGGPSPDGWIV